MNEILSSSLWPRLRKIAKKARRKLAAVAYVTDDRFIKFGDGDLLVTDASQAAIKAGQTSAQLLKRAHKRGAEIRSITGLHSKLYIFDRFAVIGSANLSKGSESLVEASLLTDQPTTVSSIRLLIGDLFNQGEVVDKKFIQKIGKIVVDKSKGKPGRRRKRKLPKSTEPKTWLIGLQPTTEKESEEEVIEEGKADAEKMVSDKNSSVSWIRLGGKSNMRKDAKEGDLVVAIWSENPKRNPTSVYSHAPILNRVDDKETDTTFLYVEDYPDAEDNAISWKQFQKLHKQLGISSKLAKFPTRELKRHHSDALHELWKN